MMMTRRFLFLLTALLGLSGCSSGPDCFTSGGVSAPTRQLGVLVVDEPAQLLLSPQFLRSCDTGIPPEPTSLSVELSDPDNEPVEHQARMGNPTTSSAFLHFTPDKPGRYHVFAAFEPVGGIQQFDLYAAKNRSAEAPLHRLSQACRAVERTQRGGWLCDTDFIRDGSVVTKFTGSRVAVAGDVVWVADSLRVQRFVDTGAALELSGTLQHVHGSAEFLLASTDELVILHGTTLQRITFNGTALASVGATLWQPGGEPVTPGGPKGLLLRKGDQLAVVASTLLSTGTANLACAYRLEAGRFVRAASDCQTFTGQIVGFEQHILWTASATFSSNTFSDLRRLEWEGGTLVSQASLPLSSDLELPSQDFARRNSVVPVIITVPLAASNQRSRGAVVVYSPERRTLQLEFLDPDLAAPVASSTLLWGSPGAGGTGAGVHIRVRPTTP